jgi:hypothetical protein
MDRVLGGPAGAGAVTLTWRPAKDAVSGVAGYIITCNRGADAPSPRCITGTRVDQQPSTVGKKLQVKVSGLTAGAAHIFRVCAMDTSGNVNAGRIWRGTPQA